MSRTLILFSLLLLCFNAGAQTTLTISTGTAGAGRLYVAATTLNVRTPVFKMGQSNQRGVETTATLPVAVQDSADVLRTYVWTFAGGGTLRKVFPRNVSAIRRTQDSILVGPSITDQLYLPQINPKIFLAEWHRGGTGLVPYPSGAGGYFNATASNAYNFDDFMTAVKNLPNCQISAGAIVWSQGENEMEDADASLAANYAANWATFASDIRSYLGYNVPIFIVKMHNYPGATHYATMVSQQATMASQAGNCFIINTDDLGASNVHYNYDEHVTISQRLANAMASYYNRARLIRVN
jgi:hypothetical protein